MFENKSVKFKINKKKNMCQTIKEYSFNLIDITNKLINLYNCLKKISIRFSVEFVHKS